MENACNRGGRNQNCEAERSAVASKAGDLRYPAGFGVYSERTTIADENTDDLCKDCGPTFTAFLERPVGELGEPTSECSPNVSEHFRV